MGEVKGTQALLKVLKNRRRRHASASSDVSYFSMDDVRQVLLDRENEQRAQESRVRTQHKQKLIEKILEEKKNSVVSAAGVADILGFNPMSRVTPPTIEVPKNIDAKFRGCYFTLQRLKNIINNKEAVTPELEFAWGMLKNEPDKLKEVQDALDRMDQGTYGICEITGEPIDLERLKAVPFARYSVRGQQEFERRSALKKEEHSGTLFGEESEDMFSDNYEESE